MKSVIYLITLLILLLSSCTYDASYSTEFVDELNTGSCVTVNYMDMDELDRKYENSVYGATKYCDNVKCCVLHQSGVEACFSADCVKILEEVE